MSFCFKGRHFEKLIILQCLGRYLRYPLSYRQLEEIMLERGIEVNHTTIYCRIQKYAPEFEKRLRWYAKPLGLSWRVDETFITFKGQWKYLYRAIDSQGNTIDFMLAHKRNTATVKRFFQKALKHSYENPRYIVTDKHASYSKSIKTLQKEGLLSQENHHNQKRYLNNIIEFDYRRIKRRLKPMLSFQSFRTANRCIKSIKLGLCL